MSIYDSIRAQIVPITPEGYPFIGAFAFASLVLFWLWSPLGWLGTVLTLWCAYFFRDPPRVTPVREGLVVAPADGRVSQITTVPPPHELGLSDETLLRISIFMSVFDCHVNRSPAAGRIEKIVYQPGKFFNADLDKASVDNERNSLVIATAGTRIAVTQIAGLIARRIVCIVREGQPLGAGERESADERIAFRCDRRDLCANRIVDRHALSYSAASAGASIGATAAAEMTSSTGGGLRLGATSSSATRASFSRASSASRWRVHMLA